MSGANLSGAYLGQAELSFANLTNAKLCDAYLNSANLTEAYLRGANLSGVVLDNTVLANIDLSVATGLETCRHGGPSVVDFRTLAKSHPLPLEFLRGVGLPDNLINYLPSLLNQPIQYYSCFISYSSKDDDFAKRLHADLQSKGVRCWFTPHDLPIGGKILDEIDTAIRLRDKVLLILSEHSIGSDWVEDEVKTAYEEERKRKQTMLSRSVWTMPSWRPRRHGRRSCGQTVTSAISGSGRTTIAIGRFLNACCVTSPPATRERKRFELIENFVPRTQRSV